MYQKFLSFVLKRGGNPPLTKMYLVGVFVSAFFLLFKSLGIMIVIDYFFPIMQEEFRIEDVAQRIPIGLFLVFSGYSGEFFGTLFIECSKNPTLFFSKNSTDQKKSKHTFSSAAPIFLVLLGSFYYYGKIASENSEPFTLLFLITIVINIFSFLLLLVYKKFYM